MLYIIDRFEGDFAIIEMEERTTFPLPRELFPDAQEGDVIQISAEVDLEATAKRRENMKRLLDHFFDE